MPSLFLEELKMTFTTHTKNPHKFLNKILYYKELKPSDSEILKRPSEFLPKFASNLLIFP